MSDRDRQALREIVQQFKPEGTSDFDAALNVVENHAAIIRDLHDQQDRLRVALRKTISVLQELAGEIASDECRGRPDPPKERVEQISVQSPADGGSTDWLPELFALTDRGNIYRWVDAEWERVRLPWEEGGSE